MSPLETRTTSLQHEALQQSKTQIKIIYITSDITSGLFGFSSDLVLKVDQIWDLPATQYFPNFRPEL
jgi:hypothetical protein